MTEMPQVKPKIIIPTWETTNSTVLYLWHHRHHMKEKANKNQMV